MYEYNDIDDNTVNNVNDDEIISIPKYCTVTDLSDYQSMALTPKVRQCFDWQVVIHIKDSLRTLINMPTGKTPPGLMPFH